MDPSNLREGTKKFISVSARRYVTLPARVVLILRASVLRYRLAYGDMR